jgi:hypothetical protein
VHPARVQQGSKGQGDDKDSKGVSGRCEATTVVPALAAVDAPAAGFWAAR